MSRTYNRIKGGAIGIIIINVALLTGIIFGSIWIAGKITDEIDEKGLKGIVEEVWYGEEGAPEEE